MNATNRRVLRWLFASAVAMPLLATEAPASVAQNILDLTGNKRVRMVWVRGNSRETIVGFDTGSGKETTVLGSIGGGGAVRPILTGDGMRVVFCTGGDVGDFGTLHKVYLVNWNGSGKQLISGDGYLASVWTDPKSGKQFAIAMKKDRRTYSKIPLDPVGPAQTFWTGPSGCRAELQLSADGRRSCLAASGIGWVDFTRNPPKYFNQGGGCRPSMAPDNSYRWWSFRGDHKSVTMRTASGSSWTLTIPRSTNEAYYPRWTNDVRFMTHTDNFKKKAASEVYFCQFSTDFKRITTSVRVTTNSIAEYHPNARILGAQPATPSLALSAANLSFSGVAGGDNPSPKTVTVTNASGGTLGTVIVSQGAPWLTVTRSGSGNTQTLTNTVDITGLNANTYTEKVTVSGGGASNSVSYTVALTVSVLVVNKPPTATALASTTSGGAPLAVDFQGSGTDADGTIVSYAWDFGDGKTSKAKQVTHTYGSPGQYTAKLTVTDDGGLSAQDTVEIRVAGITLLSPAGGEAWTAGSTQHVRWTAQYLDDVRIYFSADGGLNWTMVESSVYEGTAGWGDYSWVVPNTPSGQALIRIEGYFGEAPTISGAFEITSGGPDDTPPAIARMGLGISGGLDDPSVSTVQIDGQPYPVTGGVFGGEASLGTQKRTVTVQASDAAGNTAVRTLDVLR